MKRLTAPHASPQLRPHATAQAREEVQASPASFFYHELSKFGNGMLAMVTKMVTIGVLREKCEKATN